MKKNILFLVLCTLSLCAFFGCNNGNEPEQKAKSQTYHVTIQAGKAESQQKIGPRRALGMGPTDEAPTAYWAAGEKVTVRNLTKNADLTGYLEAQSAGVQTTISGDLTGTINAGDALELKFLSPNYSEQLGTLEYIAANCDYAVDTIHVASVTWGNITFEEDIASFENKQAIVKITIKDQSSDEPLSADRLVVEANGNSYTITPASATNILFVALPGFSNETITLTATVGSDTYTTTSSSGKTLVNGKYYTLNIGMTLAPETQHPFAISPTQSIYFAPGNLQYQASTNSWRMAENQYDFVGNSTAYFSNQKGNVYIGDQKCNNFDVENNNQYSGWIDLFGWNTANSPLNWSINPADYDLDNFVDWGTHDIYNPSTGNTDPANTWRTMSYAEWEYIIFNRENHEKLFGLASIDGLSYGDVKGLIILPDDWALPDGLSFNASTDAGNVTLIYTTSSNGPAYNYSDPNFSYSYPPEMYNTTTYMYNQNHYTVSEWAQMEAAGAVFLPAAGQRQYYSSYASFFMVNIGVEACYWTSDRHEVADALYLGSSSDAGIGKCSEMIYQGMSVRLVRDL